MDTYDEILEIYNKIMDLVDSGNFHFHVKGSHTIYENLTYKTFINILPSIEYIDDNTNNYTRIYLNPYTRTMLLVSARRAYNGDNLMLIRVPTDLINTVYSLMESGIQLEFNRALELFNSKLTSMSMANEYTEKGEQDSGD